MIWLLIQLRGKPHHILQIIVMKKIDGANEGNHYVRQVKFLCKIEAILYLQEIMFNSHFFRPWIEQHYHVLRKVLSC